MEALSTRLFSRIKSISSLESRVWVSDVPSEKVDPVTCVIVPISGDPVTAMTTFCGTTDRASIRLYCERDKIAQNEEVRQELYELFIEMVSDGLLDIDNVAGFAYNEDEQLYVASFDVSAFIEAP